MLRAFEVTETSKLFPNRMDDLITSLCGLGIDTSQTRIESSTVKYHDATISAIRAEQLRDARIEIQLDLKAFIQHDVRKFCDLYDVQGCAVENFMSLMRGNPDFPVILLQSPAANHEYLGFENMVAGCPTLAWLKNVLEELELSLDDVIILDVCPLLSDNWFRARSGDVIINAVKAAFAITEKILLFLRPKLLISCQCATKTGTLWQYATVFMVMLGSTTSAARQKEIIRFQYGSHIFNVVQAYHPRYFLGRDGYYLAEREQLLQDIIVHFLRPFGEWKAEVVCLLQLEETMAVVLKATHSQARMWQSLADALKKFADALEKCGGIQIEGGT